MIYVTGDTHANIDIAKLNTTKFPQQKELTKNVAILDSAGTVRIERCGGKTG